MLYAVGVAMLVYSFPSVLMLSAWTISVVVQKTFRVLVPVKTDEERIRAIVQEEMAKRNFLEVGGCDLILS